MSGGSPPRRGHPPPLRLGLVRGVEGGGRAEVASMRRYLTTLSAADRRGWSPEGPSIDRYVCEECGGSTFRAAQPGDCPNGATVNPVVWEG